MERLFLAFSTIFIILLSSCTNPSAYIRVWQGNNAYSEGNYQTANIDYLKALKKDTYTAFINYNMGNVSYSLGETSSATAEWQKAVITKNNDLLFRALFNRGVLEYEMGEYKKAFNSFKTALEIIPESKEAKVNLEYSLKKMNAGANSVSGGLSGVQTSQSELPADVNRVLEFVKQKEACIWQDKPKDNIEKETTDW